MADEYTPIEVPTLEQASQQAEQDPNYQAQVNLYDQAQTQELGALNTQKTGITQTYDQSRRAAFNSYQDALDQINYGMRQVGIQTRAGSAQRDLYDASGQLSGIGQGVAANAIEPLVRQTRTLGERQALTMANLNTQEQQAIASVDSTIAGLGIKSAQDKLDLKNKIIQSIIDAAQKNMDFGYEQYTKERSYQTDVAEKDRRFGLDVEKFNAQQIKDQASIPGTREYQLKVRAEQEANGRAYIGDPKLLGQLTKEGKHVIKVGGDYFQLSAKEEANLQKIAAQTNKLVSSGSTTSSDKVTQTMKNDYNTSLLGLGDAVVTSGKPGPGEITREDAAKLLAKQYPFLSLDSILKQIYTAYPDAYSGSRVKQNNQINYSVLNFPGF